MSDMSHVFNAINSVIVEGLVENLKTTDGVLCCDLCVHRYEKRANGAYDTLFTRVPVRLFDAAAQKLSEAKQESLYVRIVGKLVPAGPQGEYVALAAEHAEIMKLPAYLAVSARKE